MLFGLFAVPQQATAVDTITKTFTIRGADNSLLSGAQVMFWWSDPVTGAQVYGTPAATNSSGVVTLTAPLNAPTLTYSVFPAVGDRQNALFDDTQIASSSNGSVSVKLSAANIFINVQKSDGSNITPGAVLIYPKANTWTWNKTTLAPNSNVGIGAVSVVRSGVVGLRVAPDLDVNADYVLGVLQYTDNYMPGQFSWRYGLKATGSSGNQSYSVYSNPKLTGNTLQPVNGAYELKYSGANIIGTLKNSDGSTFTMTSGMTLNTQLGPSGWSPSTNFPPSNSGDFTDAIKSPTGNWFARGLGDAGKYQLGFTFGGSTTVASFVTYIWKNSSGGWSLDENGPFVGDAVTPAQIEVRRPSSTPQLVFEMKSSDANLALPGYLEFQVKNGANYSNLTTTRLLNGKFAGLLPPGNSEYKINFDPSDSRYAFSSWSVVATNGVVTSIKDSYENSVVPVNGIYTLLLSPPNLTGKIKDSSGTDLVFGQGQGANIAIQKWNSNNNNWDCCSNWKYITSADWSIDINETGKFRVMVRPDGFSGISESYSEPFYVVAGTPKKMSKVSESAANSGSTTSLSDVNISMRVSNVKLSILNPIENALLEYGWINFFKKNADGNGDSFIGSAEVRKSAPGIAETRLDDGNYRVEINPIYNGTLISGLATKSYDLVVSNSGATLSMTFKGSAAISLDSNGRFPLVAARANVTGTITDQSGTLLANSNGKWVSINIQKYSDTKKEFEWTPNWSNTDQTGGFNISLSDPGKYRLKIQPTGFAGSSTFFSPEFTLVTGSEEIKLGALKAPLPTLSGVIYAPDGTTAIRDARIRVVNTANNQELWQNEAFTNSSGLWSMSLPEGSYSIYAAAPWGSTTYGNSDKIGTVTVNSSGVASLTGSAATGRTASTFNIRLKSPTWSGVVKNPAGTAVVPNAQVCLALSNEQWYCTDANDLGQWALSAPDGFTSFPNTAFVQIADWRGRAFPLRRFNDASAALGGLTASGLTLSFQTANVSITVTDGTNPIQDVWVSLIRPGSGWIAGNNTNSSGRAQMNIDDLTKALEVRVEIGGNSPASGRYASQVVNFSGSAVTTNKDANSGVFTTTIELAAPNFTGIVREPNATWASGSIVADAWIELFNSSNNEFVTSTNSGSDGKFSLNAPKPQSGETEYTLVVNPAWNSTTTFSKKSYSVIVSSTGSLTVTAKSPQASVATISTTYLLSLASPNVTGSVVNPSNSGVANSWVVPISVATGEYFWQYGSNTRPAGTFGMNLPNGEYKIDANLPWNSTGVAKPAQCTVTVSGGSITSAASSCVIENNGQKTVKLALRTPNVIFTLKQGGNPVSGANVSLGVGKWNINAQSNSSGVVSLFVDPVEIAAKSGLSGTQDIRVWVDPPWGTSSMVRWDCNSGDAKPICSLLSDVNLSSTTYTAVPNTDVTVLGPNSKIRIIDPRTNAHVGVNAWVSIFSYDSAAPQNGNRWVGGSNSDTDGYVTFNIETITATTRFTVEVNPPWDKRVSLTRVEYNNSGNGYTDAELKANGLSFPLGTPNTVVTVKAPGGAADNKWGWIGIEEVNPANNNFVAWVGGYGLNDTGTAAITLAANKRYKITANASSGRPGAQTTCFISTDGSIAISAVTNLCTAGSIQANTNNLTITMVAGNVAGFVKYNNVGVANATVYASLVGAANDDDSVFAATLSDGSFGFNLDFSGGKQWVIKVFPFNAPGETALANQTLATLSAQNANLVVNLAVRS